MRNKDRGQHAVVDNERDRRIAATLPNDRWRTSPRSGGSFKKPPDARTVSAGARTGLAQESAAKNKARALVNNRTEEQHRQTGVSDDDCRSLQLVLQIVADFHLCLPQFQFGKTMLSTTRRMCANTQGSERAIGGSCRGEPVRRLRPGEASHAGAGPKDRRTPPIILRSASIHA